jgi:hypothetical protein
MRILIYALPRTGSTALAQYIANSFHYREFIEPYHEKRYWDKDVTEFDIWERDNVVVKVIFGQGGYWYDDIKDKFDKVVILYRRNIKEQAESFVYANKGEDWHTKYIYDPLKVTQEEYDIAYKMFSRKQEIEALVGFKVTYEDLYISGKDRDRLDTYLGNTNKSFRFMLDSKNKYRQNGTEVKKTLI